MLAAIPHWQSVVLVIERLLTPGRFPNWQCVVSLGKTLHAYFPLGSTDRAVYPLWWPSSRNTCKQNPIKYSAFVWLDRRRVPGSCRWRNFGMCFVVAAAVRSFSHVFALFLSWFLPFIRCLILLIKIQGDLKTKSIVNDYIDSVESATLWWYKGVERWILLCPWIRRFTISTLLSGFERVAKTVDKILKKSTGTLDHS